MIGPKSFASCDSEKKSPFFCSIRSELLISFLLVVAFVAGVSLGFVSLFMHNYASSLIEKQLMEDSQILKKYESRVFLPGVLDELYEKIAGSNFSLLILHSDLSLYDGRNIDVMQASVGENFETEFASAIRPCLRQDGVGKILLNGQEYFVLVQPIARRTMDGFPQEIIGYIVLASGGMEVSTVNAAFRLYGIGLALASVFSILVSFLISDMLTANIKRLKNRAQLIAERKFDETIPIHTHDELADLSQSMEEMAQNMQTYDFNQKVFLQNASHELRTPLMSIRGYVEGLRDGVFTDTDEAYELILGQVSRLEKLVGEVLYLSRIETTEGAIQRSEVSVHDIFDEVCGRVKGLVLASPISVEVHELPDRTLYVDADSMATALTNILTNDLRYAKSRISVFVQPEEQHLLIRISDDGNGFSEEDLSHLFERFYKGAKGKFGLGLSIAKAVVEANGGTISAYNNSPDSGAVFEIVLPLSPQKDTRN